MTKSNNEEKQKNLFNLLSEHYKNYTNRKEEDLFQCPLCKKEFDIISLERGKLSLAHIIPDFIDGNLTTLTCKKCNNKIGSSIEGPESLRRSNLTKLQDGGILKAHIYRDNRNQYLPADIEINTDEDEISIGFRLKNGNPEFSNEFYQGLQNSQDNQDIFNFNFEFKWPVWEIASLTYLHAAYLFLFMQFGYHWTINKASERIRRKLLYPKSEIISFCPILCPIDKNSSVIATLDGDFPFSMYRIIEPASSRGLLVAFSKTSIYKNEPFSVWMPHINEEYKFPSSPKFQKIKKLPVFRSHNHLTNCELNYGLLCSIL